MRSNSSARSRSYELDIAIQASATALPPASHVNRRPSTLNVCFSPSRSRKTPGGLSAAPHELPRVTSGGPPISIGGISMELAPRSATSRPGGSVPTAVPSDRQGVQHAGPAGSSTGGLATPMAKRLRPPAAETNSGPADVARAAPRNQVQFPRRLAPMLHTTSPIFADKVCNRPPQRVTPSNATCDRARPHPIQHRPNSARNGQFRPLRGQGWTTCAEAGPKSPHK